MADALELARLNLLSPVVLAFVLGLVATWVRSDLRIPDEIRCCRPICSSRSVSKAAPPWRPRASPSSGSPVSTTLALGAATPLWCFAILRRVLGLGVEDSAALAEHYGSVSAVTYVASVGFVAAAGAPADGMMPALLALLEIPGIAVALLVARARSRGPVPLGEALLVAADPYRPAAADQLETLGRALSVPVHRAPPGTPVVEIATGGIEAARHLVRDLVILDTAGRLTVDDALMAEIAEVATAVRAVERLLVVDAMTGQQAVAVASAFHAAVPRELFRYPGVVAGAALVGDRNLCLIPVGDQPPATHTVVLNWTAGLKTKPAP